MATEVVVDVLGEERVVESKSMEKHSSQERGFLDPQQSVPAVESGALL